MKPTKQRRMKEVKAWAFVLKATGEFIYSDKIFWRRDWAKSNLNDGKMGNPDQWRIARVIIREVPKGKK